MSNLKELASAAPQTFQASRRSQEWESLFWNWRHKDSLLCGVGVYTGPYDRTCSEVSITCSSKQGEAVHSPRGYHQTSVLLRELQRYCEHRKRNWTLALASSYGLEPAANHSLCGWQREKFDEFVWHNCDIISLSYGRVIWSPMSTPSPATWAVESWTLAHILFMLWEFTPPWWTPTVSSICPIRTLFHSEYVFQINRPWS